MSTESQYEPYLYVSKSSLPAIPIEEGNNLMEIRLDIEEEESVNEDCNKDNVNEIILNVDDTFKDWESVQIAIDLYAKQNGFVANKCRKDVDPANKSIV